MDLSRCSLAFSLLVLSLLAIASAGDYSDASSKYGFDGIPADSPQAKPEEAEKTPYGTKPVYNEKPEEKEKPAGYYTKPKPEGNVIGKQDTYTPKSEEKGKPYVVKPKPVGEEKPNYGANQDKYKPKPKSEEKEKPYVVKPKPVGEEKPNYGANQDKYKPKPEERDQTSYNRNSYVVKPKPDSYKQAKPGYGKGYEKPSYGTNSEEMKNHLSIAVQGSVLCKTGSKYYPIQGALATITCKAVDEVGVEKTVSICSKPTDAKGYFFVPLSGLGGDKLKLRECKSYLKSSPMEACNVPSNVNKAIEGALLSAFRVLNEKKTKLYSVGPFFYTSQAKPATAPAHGY